jgi:Fe-S cluster assembly protein SufD
VSGAGFAAPHTTIVTGANSRVTVIEEFSSADDDIVVLPVAEVVPGPGAEVRHYVVHRWGPKTRVFLNQRFLGAGRDAAYKSLHMVLGGAVVKGHLESTMQERGTASELLGVAYGLGNTNADFYTLQDHVGPDTRSDLKYKSALKDEARAVYYGLTRVGLGARNADANQENRNLLLSKSARADSDPVLEILTSDIIRASHGATAGPVDQEQLFYLQARGIPRAEAEALLVTAYLEDVLARVPDEAIRGELIALLEEKLDA